jgi:hypothetical protein
MYLLIIPLFAAFDAAIKCSRRFISTSDLYLHEKGGVMRTLGAPGFSTINILPCIRSSKHIINLFLLNFNGA